MGEVHNGLYLLQKSIFGTAPSLSAYLSTNKAFKLAFSTSTSNKDMSTIWDFKLGHPSLYYLLWDCTFSAYCIFLLMTICVLNIFL